MLINVQLETWPILRKLRCRDLDIKRRDHELDGILSY